MCDSQDNTQLHCPTCRSAVPEGATIDAPHADLVALIEEIREMLVALGLHVGAEGFFLDEES